MKKHYGTFIILIIIVAILGFFLYGYIKHQPKGTVDYNCDDFDSQESAQEFFVRRGGPESDPYNLDGDKNGQACNGHYYPQYKKIAKTWTF